MSKHKFVFFRKEADNVVGRLKQPQSREYRGWSARTRFLPEALIYHELHRFGMDNRYFVVFYGETGQDLAGRDDHDYCGTYHRLFGGLLVT